MRFFTNKFLKKYQKDGALKFLYSTKKILIGFDQIFKVFKASFLLIYISDLEDNLTSGYELFPNNLTIFLFKFKKLNIC